MSDFDLRKFLAEQKAPKEEAVEEAKHEEELEEAQDHEMEETYHEGEDSMEEGEVDESVIAGIAALIGSSLAAGEVLKYIAKKYPKAIEKFLSATKNVEKAAGHSGSGDSYITQEGEEANEEELKENTFKSSIKDILNS